MYSCWGHAATEKAKDLLDAFYKQHYLYVSVTLVSLQGKVHRVIMTLRFFSSEMQLSTHFLAWSFTTEKKKNTTIYSYWIAFFSDHTLKVSRSLSFPQSLHIGGAKKMWGPCGHQIEHEPTA